MAIDTEAQDVEGEGGIAQDPRRPAVAKASQIGQLPDNAPDVDENKLTPDEAKDALDWFLSDEEIPLTKTLKITLGEREYLWEIRAIDFDTIKRARKLAEEGGQLAAKRARQTGVAPEVDSQQANARIIVAATIKPDLRHAAAVKMQQDGLSHTSPDVDFPAMQLVLHRLRTKPGIIDQIAGAILNLSGYDEEDVVEHAAGKL